MSVEIKCKYEKLINIDSIVPHKDNNNKHPKKQIELLSKLIKNHGFRHPLIISKRSNFLISGHGRLEAAKLLGMEEVPVDYQEFENEAMEYAFLTSDNKSTQLAEFDDAMMLDKIKELELDENFDLELFGISDFTFLQDTFEEEAQEALSSEEKKYLIEVSFANEMEMRDIFDDLSSRGYIVKIK